MARKMVMAHVVIDALSAAGIVDMPTDRLRRVVIDLEAGALPKLYTEQFLDERVVDALLHCGLDGLPPARTLPVKAWKP